MSTATSASLRPMLWLVATAAFMQMLDTTIVNTALPSMAIGLGESPLRMQAVVASYALAVAMVIPASGWLADKFGTRQVFLAHPDRILFGTDLGVGREPGDLMLGSTGATPPTAADVDRFFASTWRFFETRDKAFAHPTPVQGKWTIDGIGLPRDVLHKVYGQNAERVLKLR